MQSRTDSLMESLTNVVIGFSINFIANILFLPLVLHVPVNLHELGLIGAIFTVISVVRSYALRRAFNGRTVWQAIKDRFGREPDVNWPDVFYPHPIVRAPWERAQQARQSVNRLIERP